MLHKNIPTLEELKARRKPTRNVSAERRERFTPLERLALALTKRVGTMEFFLILLVWTVLWLLWNISAPNHLRFDPFPAFVLWLFVSNLIQLLLTPLLLVGQNLQNKDADARAQADYEVNLQSEREIEAILMRLETQEKYLAKLIDYLHTRKRK